MAKASTALARSPIIFSRASAPLAKSGSSARIATIKRESSERLKAFSARAKQHVVAQRHRYMSIGVGLGLGLMRRFAPGTMESLTLAGGAVTPELTIGLGALIASMFVKSEVLDHLATAGLTVAAYQFGSGAGVEGTAGAGEL